MSVPTVHPKVCKCLKCFRKKIKMPRPFFYYNGTNRLKISKCINSAKRPRLANPADSAGPSYREVSVIHRVTSEPERPAIEQLQEEPMDQAADAVNELSGALKANLKTEPESPDIEMAESNNLNQKDLKANNNEECDISPAKRHCREDCRNNGGPSRERRMMTCRVQSAPNRGEGPRILQSVGGKRLTGIYHILANDTFDRSIGYGLMAVPSPARHEEVSDNSDNMSVAQSWPASGPTPSTEMTEMMVIHESE